MLDASAGVEFLLNSPAGQRVAERVGQAETLHVPHLFSVEVAQAFRRLVATGRAERASVEGALEDLSSLDATRYPHELLLPRVWELRDNLTMYDALYIALAEALPAPLLSFDHHLAEAPGHRAVVEIPPGA